MKKSAKFHVKRQLRRAHRHAVKRALCEHSASHADVNVSEALNEIEPLTPRGKFTTFNAPNTSRTILVDRPRKFHSKRGADRREQTGE